MKSTIIGVDLAKNVIQVCVVTNGKVIMNKELSAQGFASWLASQKKAIVVFEACGTSNYWKQVALEYDHDARLISAQLVSRIRQHQKTDKNDALAIVQASQLVDIQFIQGKTFAQQELQSLMRLRELAVKQRKASRQQIQALLLEFNIKTGPRQGTLSTIVASVLEDGENGFSDTFREGLDFAWKTNERLTEAVVHYEKLLACSVSEQPACQQLMKLEGVSTLNAVNLFLLLGTNDVRTFQSGREAAACLGLTPKQYSSGGTIKLGSIGKVKNTLARSYLISGAMSVVRQVIHREPKTTKERWLKELIERRGTKCAAVALANKTVRTAYALLTQGTEYQAQSI